jgi:hypothetical protein
VPQANNNWGLLYDYFVEAEKHRDELKRKRQEDVAAIQEFEQWCQGAIDRLMNDLKHQALRRSEEFLAATGQTLEVQYPSGPPIMVPDQGPEIRFLKIALGDSQVHIYSSHAVGGVTHIHLLPSQRNSLRENHRLVSEPGAFLVRRPDDHYELRHMRGDPSGPAGSPMTGDNLLYRAFRLLILWAEEPPVTPGRRS